MSTFAGGSYLDLRIQSKEPGQGMYVCERSRSKPKAVRRWGQDVPSPVEVDPTCLRWPRPVRNVSVPTQRV